MTLARADKRAWATRTRGKEGRNWHAGAKDMERPEGPTQIARCLLSEALQVARSRAQKPDADAREIWRGNANPPSDRART